jgi:hypothetical protein
MTHGTDTKIRYVLQYKSKTRPEDDWEDSGLHNYFEDPNFIKTAINQAERESYYLNKYRAVKETITREVVV